jgi:hypothetical protein
MGNYASKGDSYTISETDQKFTLKTDVYTKPESDAKFAAFASSYTKPESDSRFAFKNESYTKNEIDTKLQNTSDIDSKLKNLNTNNVWCADGQLCQLPPNSSGIKFGDYTLQTIDKQLCLSHSNGTFCFDGKIIIPK